MSLSVEVRAAIPAPTSMRQSVAVQPPSLPVFGVHEITSAWLSHIQLVDLLAPPICSPRCAPQLVRRRLSEPDPTWLHRPAAKPREVYR
uniref:Uncharacterized protein n=1 Tax=Peronospora matthiolae TaxID=2874970 RepID=A0AAV1V4A4_9STRA